jgi:hypothetical protein
MILFEYPVTRPIYTHHLLGLLFISLAALVVVTVFNFQASGYEKLPLVSNDFNKTVTLWYQKFVPNKIHLPTPEAWQCDASTIKVNEGYESL